MPGSRVEPVARVAELSRDAFERDFVRPGRPVVIEGLFRDWPALRLDFPSLIERFGTRNVTVEDYASGDRFDLESRRQYQVTVDAFVRGLAIGEPAPPSPPPALFCIVRHELPELLPELEPPNLLERDRQYPCNLIAGRDTIVFGHYHVELHALLGQIHGEKTIALCPPEDTPRMHPYPLFGPLFSTSRVDFLNPDLARFPKFRDARPATVVLGPGDALFIPAHWWHATYGANLSMTASLFWKARLREHRFPHPGLRNVAALSVLWPRGRVRALRARFQR